MMDESNLVARVYCANSEEFTIAQQLFFVLGYEWPSNKKELYVLGDNPYLSIWKDGELLHSSDGGTNVKTLTQLLDFIDNNNILHE